MIYKLHLMTMMSLLDVTHINIDLIYLESPNSQEATTTSPQLLFKPPLPRKSDNIQNKVNNMATL